MKYLHSVLIEYEDGYDDRQSDLTHIVRDDNYVSNEDAWDVARAYFERNGMDYQISEVYCNTVTEVDGHKIRVGCKPQERSEQ